MGPAWDYNEAFGLCCGFPFEVDASNFMVMDIFSFAHILHNIMLLSDHRDHIFHVDESYFPSTLPSIVSRTWPVPQLSTPLCARAGHVNTFANSM